MNQQPSTIHFAYFDGDDVGARIELCLIGDDASAATEVSKRVSAAIEALSAGLVDDLNARVLFAAGDEVLAAFSGTVATAELDALRRAFHEGTGLTVSCGVGSSAKEAAFQLRLAKLSGKDRTCGAGGV